MLCKEINIRNGKGGSFTLHTPLYLQLEEWSDNQEKFKGSWVPLGRIKCYNTWLRKHRYEKNSIVETEANGYCLIS